MQHQMTLIQNIFQPSSLSKKIKISKKESKKNFKKKFQKKISKKISKKKSKKKNSKIFFSNLQKKS